MPTDLPLNRICPTCLMTKGSVNELAFDQSTSQLVCRNVNCQALFTDNYLRRVSASTERLLIAFGHRSAPPILDAVGEAVGHVDAVRRVTLEDE